MDKYINKFNQLLENYNTFKSNPDNKKLRIRDAASKLNVSEAELLSLKINNDVSYLLIPDFQQFFNKIIDNIDKVMFLIRSDFVVHEKIVSLSDLSYNDGSIISNLDSSCPIISFDPKSISYSFFECNCHNEKRELRSFQFFDKYGDAILKIYLKGDKSAAFERIADFYKINYNYELQKYIINKKINIVEQSSFLHIDSLVNKKFINNTKIINNDKLRFFLNAFSENEIPIQIHAYGINCIQYHRGIIKNIIDYGPWLNVIDKEFNIHILENKIFKTTILDYKDELNNFYIVNITDINNNLVLGIAGLDKNINEFNEVIKKGAN
ncbi:MAG: hypothetical protein CMG46_14030 [Candidatus Marinimicrobia bacterium]|nr:hypothetical protein [Candidatus Neomarinimicrobiota bacterium]